MCPDLSGSVEYEDTMTSATRSVVGALIVGLSFAVGAGAQTSLETPQIEDTSLNTSTDPIHPDDVYDLYSQLPAGTSETISTMANDTCAFGLKVLNDQGWYLPPERDVYGHEYDLLSGACKDFRDTVEHRVLNGDDPPYIEVCKSGMGATCVAVGHYACDFVIIIGSGMVYYCLGGITPYN